VSKEQEVVGKCIMRILVICTARQIPVGRSDRLGVDGRACGKHEGEGLAGFLLGSLNLGDHLKGLGVVGWIISKRVLKEQAVRLWTALSWPRTGTRAGLLCTR